VEGEQLPWLLNAMFTIAMAAAGPPPIAMTSFHNTNGPFILYLKKNSHPPDSSMVVQAIAVSSDFI
jgi:hypothetical protein